MSTTKTPSEIILDVLKSAEFDGTLLVSEVGDMIELRLKNAGYEITKLPVQPLCHAIRTLAPVLVLDVNDITIKD